MQYKVVKKHSGSLTSTDGLPIDFDVYAPHTDSGTLPLILFLHGFKGFKDWGTFPDAFFEMARHGFAVLAMNFGHDGINSSTGIVDKPEFFRSQSLSQEIEDVRTVVNAVMNGEIASSTTMCDLYPLGIIGHSRGGLTAVLAAAEIDEISCLVTWAAVSDSIDFLGDKAVKQWKRQGSVEVENKRTGQTLEIGNEFIDDLLNNRDRLSALNRVKDLYIPSLFIHGTNDETVPHMHSQLLHEASASADKEKFLIEGASHTFGSSHPFEDEDLPVHFTEVVDQTIKWFQVYLV
jgi:fermentation-respiration switch protein FrsA (DUF1100 family)